MHSKRSPRRASQIARTDVRWQRQLAPNVGAASWRFRLTPSFPASVPLLYLWGSGLFHSTAFLEWIGAAPTLLPPRCCPHAAACVRQLLRVHARCLSLGARSLALVVSALALVVIALALAASRRDTTGRATRMREHARGEQPSASSGAERWFRQRLPERRLRVCAGRLARRRQHAQTRLEHTLDAH